DDGAVGHDELLDAVPEGEAHESACDALVHRPGEGLDDGRTRAPRDVEARDGVAVPAREPTTALGPADDGEELQPALPQVRALLARGELDIGLRPALRPRVLGPVELGRAAPVLPREGERVTHPHAPLL